MSSEKKPLATPPVYTSEEDLEEIIVEESILASPLAGGIIGTGGLAVLAGVFVYGARKNDTSLQLVSPPPASQSPPDEAE